MNLDYQSPYNSTAHKLLESAGGIFLGKANMDEFAMGSNNLTSNLYQPPVNPIFQTQTSIQDQQVALLVVQQQQLQQTCATLH